MKKVRSTSAEATIPSVDSNYSTDFEFPFDSMSYGDPRYDSVRPRGDSKDPQLADHIAVEHEEIELEEFQEVLYIPKICTDLIEPRNRNEFYFYHTKDNWDALTLKFMPDLWDSKSHVYHKIIDYCKPRDINYYFIFECGEQNINLHAHGIFGFPNGKSRKNFQTWHNKYLGKILQSPKKDEDGLDRNLAPWYDYIHGLVKGKIPV
jgi:hypothetical protein